MAEILLEPSSLSKIIPLSFDLNDTNASNATQLMTKRQFNTADTDAWFQISLEGFVDTAGSFDITLFNLNDKSVFNHTGKPFTTNPFYYKLDSESDETTNEIRHAGRWIGQIVVTLTNGDSATRKFIFDIEGHILDGADVQTILLEDYNALIAMINTSKDLLTQYNVDYAALLVDLAAAETARTNTYNQLVADQQANIDAFDVALDTGIVAANLATKLQDFEATNNSRLLSAEQQLAETSNRIDDIITTPVPTGEIIGQEIVDARQGELSLGANISEVKSQLAQTAQSVPQMGENVKASVFGGDFTTKFEDVPKIDGAYFTPSEVTITAAGWCYGFVDISNDQISKLIVTLTELSDTAVLHFADKDKNLLQNIGGWVTSGTYEYTSIPTGTKYLCVSSKLEDVSKISVEVQQIGGGIYEEITDKLIDQSEEIKTYVKQSVFKEGLETIEFADIEITKGYFISAAGTKVADASYCYGYVPVADAILYTANLENVIPGSVIISNARIDKSHIIYFMNWMSSGTYTNYLDYNSIVKYAAISCKITDIEKISLNIRKKSYEAEISGNRQDAIRNGAAYAHTRIPHEKFIKGLHLDAGRKYFNLANIKTLIDNAHAAGLNTFQLYFSDNNGFRFGLNDMSINVYGDVYDLSIALGDGVAPTDGTDKWLTQAEMDEIITYANSKGIEVIPAFDMPGHFGAIELAFPDSKFDVTKEYGIEFSIEILKKYANYFASRGCRYYNICGDEVVMTVEQYEAFMGRALNEIVRANMIPMFYNDMVCVEGYNKPAMNNGGIVLGWIRRPGEHAPYEDIVKAGYRMLNAASSNYYYWTLGLHTTTPELVENIRNSDIFKMADYKVNRNITGVMYHIWCDEADLDGPDEGDNVVAQTAACIEAFGEAVNRQVPGDYVPEEKIQTSSDFESLGNGTGVILKSPDGTKYKVYVNDSGVLTTESL